MDDFYDADELRAIETAGRNSAASMRRLRADDDQNKRAKESHIPWTALAAKSEYPNEGTT